MNKMGAPMKMNAPAKDQPRNSSRVNRPRKLKSLANTRCSFERDDVSSKSSSRSRLLVAHDLFRKPVSTFRDHAHELREVYQCAPNST
jgi:hypothetical protein